MLVLSRRADQQIVFPNLDIKLQVLQVKGKVVKLGIEAPNDVAIIRPEACNAAEIEAFHREHQPGVDRHQLRNHLNAINLGLRLFQKQTDVGMTADAQETMQRVVAELGKLDAEVGHGRQEMKKASTDSPVRLLVVEDDDNERELLAGLLRLHGFDVDCAASGVEAMDYLGTHDAPDFVLLDMKMPKVDGPTTIRQIRADERLAKLKVFAVSGTSPESMGVTDDVYSGWFPKPLDPERLIHAITKDNVHASTSA